MASSSSRKRFGCVCVGVCIRTSYRPRPRLHSMNILDVIGATPMIDLGTGVAGARPGDRIRLLGKLEGNNPAGSVKDRPARSMIVSAEARGDLRRGVRLIEPTSGNTGIALAMIAAARGYAIELVRPENATAERVAVMRAFGGHVVLTPAAGGMEQAIDHARAKVSAGGYLMLDQFANPDNPLAHYETTGPEIWSGSAGQVTHFVSAMGTTGTIMGVSRFLKEQRREIVVIGCQPAEGSSIPGIRRWSEGYAPKIYDAARVDRVIDVEQHDAEHTARSLARDDALFCGTSSGGAVWAAREVCRDLAAAGKDGTVVCVLCDRGDRYVSSPLFAGGHLRVRRAHRERLADGRYALGARIEATARPLGVEANRRFVERLVGELERAPVHRNEPARPEINERLHRLFRVHVLLAHEPGGVVRTDGQHRGVDDPGAPADLGEAVEVGGVARMVDARRRAPDQDPAVPRPRRANARLRPPVELGAPQALAREERREAQSADDGPPDGAQRPDVEGIAVIVRHQLGIDERQRRRL